MLGLGWYSTNILGNRDGEVLDDPESFKTKEESKLGVLEHILPRPTPQLYGNIFHKVRISTTRCGATTRKGGTTSTSSGGSATDADQGRLPVPRLDPRRPARPRPRAVRDLAQRAGLGGIQEWLSFYYKAPRRRRAVPRARPLHPAHQVEEHAALDDGRGPDHPPRPRVLRHAVLIGRVGRADAAQCEVDEVDRRCGASKWRSARRRAAAEAAPQIDVGDQSA